MLGQLGEIRLTINEFLEAMSDDNRFYTARTLNKASCTLTAAELVAHYVANTSEPRVWPQFHTADDPFQTLLFT